MRRLPLSSALTILLLSGQYLDCNAQPCDDCLDASGLAHTAAILASQQLRGFVDFHTHPMSHLGFGEKAMHGVPDLGMLVPAGNNLCNPSRFRATTIDQALGNCNGTHGGKDLLSNTCGDYIRAAIINYGIDGNFIHISDNPLGDHAHPGFPDFAFWPHQSSILHQQMWWEWIERAYQGGLRVMVALTVNNELLATILNGTPPYDDMTVSELQISETIRMVENHDFMEIATSASELRRIVRDDKLAVVLGSEIDRIGNLGANTLASESAVRAHIQRLYDLGVRYVFPVHLVDNAFGSAAVNEPIFSFANNQANGYHFSVETSSDPNVTYDAKLIQELPIFGNVRNTPDVENVSIITLRIILSVIGELPVPCFDDISCLPVGKVRCCGSYQETVDVLQPSPDFNEYISIPPGHMNALPLTSLGRAAIDQMMSLGMMIDLDHMSQKTMTEVIEIAENASTKGYPLVFGHNSIRDADMTERQAPAELVERVALLGGMIGVGTADTTPAAFAESYRTVRDHMGPGRLGIGTDVNGFEPLPRNAESCEINQDRAGSDSFYDRFLRESGITSKSSMGNRTWDYVLDCGVSHYGLMPEFLFDVQTFHQAPDVYYDLMRSAEGFAQMWEKAEEESREVN